MRFKLHSLGIVDGLFHLDAHEYILHLPILFIDIMHVVRGDRLNIQLLCQLQQERQDAPLLLQTVILYLNIKIRAEDLFKFKRRLFGTLVIAAQQKFGDAPRKACRKTHEPFAVLAQEFVVDARLIIKPVDERGGVELDEIFISRFILCQQDEMLEIAAAVLDVHILRHVQFAADDRLYFVFFAKFCKVQRRIHIAVVGDCARLDVVFDAMIDQIVHLAGAVEQAVFGM